MQNRIKNTEYDPQLVYAMKNGLLKEVEELVVPFVQLAAAAAALTAAFSTQLLRELSSLLPINATSPLSVMLTSSLLLSCVHVPAA